MTILDLITNSEELEPETLQILFPELSQLERERIMVIKLIMQSNVIFEDMDVFENAVFILNNINPDVDHMSGVTPKMLWKAILEIKKIRKQFEFSHEVLMYIKYIFNDNGLYFYPENIGFENKHLKEIKEILKTGKRLTENFLDIQAYKYKKVNYAS